MYVNNVLDNARHRTSSRGAVRVLRCGAGFGVNAA